MPIFALTDEIIFPPPQWANEQGILAIGGDLQPERLLLAYEKGIFPWYSEDEPIIWWSPDPRFVLRSSNLKVSKSMKQVLRSEKFQITFDQNFSDVIQNCQQIKRKGQPGTWITNPMYEAYIKLHELGYAHSVEVWENAELVGGLYGISLGRAFFGESMFSKVSNASKTGFIHLVNTLKRHHFELIDCQVYTQHLARFGAEEIHRSDFLAELEEALTHRTIQGNWEWMVHSP